MLNTLVHTPRLLLAAALMSVAALGASPATAKAGGFAMITLDNPTVLTVYYEFKWGADGDWESYAVEPGRYANRWHALDQNGRAPAPYIRFADANLAFQSYQLGFYASASRGQYQGKQYVFQIVPGGTYGPYLDLKSK